MTPGRYYIVFVPPGWLLAIKVESVTATEVVCADAAYLESAGEESCPISQLPTAADARRMAKISKKSWPLHHGVILQRQGILIAVPCDVDLSPLTRSDTVATIRGAQ